ncbi:MAG: Hsp20/alpha crystallin family protein [Casimicrobiaceae bacterium]|nr:Hsp20/alpha crystallin family protein [Casimicrobiaceae bacterium]MCX8099301.1 Hsp20/alpha crystallin family protein [Casimicrobiaceae bacterium]MDW8312351.1 Hsp20/alpha crystallin family protein [Burkholderiales bacterium]
MTALLPRNPAASLIDEFFRDFAPGFFVKPLHGETLPARIPVEIKENDREYTVHAEIPGVKKEDISIDIDGAVVTIRAEVKQHNEQREGDKVLKSERYYGAVSRSFQLPMEIDEASAKAKYENGVLSVTLPKRVATNVKRLTIE